MAVDKNIRHCPYCGSEEYYIKQSYKGICDYVIRFDGEGVGEANSDMHEGARYRNISKYAWCYRCNKRLFVVE